MVVSFQIARIGTRYRSKHKPEAEASSSGPEEDEVDAHAKVTQVNPSTSRKRSVDVMEEDYHNIAESSDAKVSFILSIFADGYTIADATESNDWRVHDDLQFLRPYDWRSETMITAIECGYLPTDFLDDIQCKYINGTVLCEVRDYRKESSKSAADIPSVKKVSLQMTLNNVVKDIHLISDKTWEYGDLLEMESRILLALQPKLNLDPTPNLDQLCREPTCVELNLDIRGKRLKRLRPVSEPESSKSREPESIQDHFSKIKMLTARFKLNCKINKIEDDYKPTIQYSSEELKHALSNNRDKDILEAGPCKMPLSMSLMGGNINICKTRVLNFELQEPPTAENGSAEIPKFYTGLILSERQSDGTVAIHQGNLDAASYFPSDRLLSPLKNTHMADLLAKQFIDLMLRDGYKLAGDHIKSTPVSVVVSNGNQPDKTPEEFNKWLLQIMKDDPRELFYELNEPSSHHNMRPQHIGLNPGVSTARKRPQVVHSYWESRRRNKAVHQPEQSQIQRPTIMRPGGNHFSTVGFQGLRMCQNQTATRSPVAIRALSPIMDQNLTAARQEMGQSNTNVPGGSVGQSSNFGGLLQGVNRQIHLGSGSGSGLGSSGVSMLGSGTSINRVDHMMQMTQNHYMNHQQQQQFQLIKQEPTSDLQAVSGSGSGPSGFIMLGSGAGINRAGDINAMQMAQNRYMNHQQLQLMKQEATYNLQTVSGLGSGASGVTIPGSGAGINRAGDMNAMQMAQNRNMNHQQQLQLIKQDPISNLQAVSGLGSELSGVMIPGSATATVIIPGSATGYNTMQMAQNHYMNQHQLQLVKQEPTSHLQAVSGLGSGSSGVVLLGPGAAINQASGTNALQMAQNHYMNQQQFQQDISGPGSGSSGVVMLGPGAAINQASDINAMQVAQNRYMNQQHFQQDGSGLGSGSSGVVLLGPGAAIKRANDMNAMQMAQNRCMTQQQFQQDGSGFGSGSGSGPSGVVMLGPSAGLNRGNDMNAILMAQNLYMNQQQFQQDGSGSGSGSSSVLMLGSGRDNDMNGMQRNFMACSSQNQNRHINQQQFQLVSQQTSNLQAESGSGSGSGSGPSGVLMLGPGIGIKRANDMNPMQRNVMARLNPNHHIHMNQQQQFQLVKQDPTSHLQAVQLPTQQASSPSPSTGKPPQRAGPHQPTP